MIKAYTANYYWGSEKKILVQGDSLLFNNQFSTDGGTTWNTITIDPKTLPTYYFAPTVLSFNGSEMYLGTFYNGICKSTDFGKTFTTMNNGFPSWYGFYSSPHVIEFYNNKPIIATYSGIFLWDGNIWVNHTGSGLPTTNINGGTGPLIGSLDFLNSTWIASTNFGVYTSTDLGANWKKITAIPDITGLKKWSLFSQPGVYYNVDVINGNIYVSFRNNIYVSTNGGTTFNSLQLPDKVNIHKITEVNSIPFAVADNGVYKLMNNQWTTSNSGFDRQVIARIKTNGKDAFFTRYGGGLFYSSDQGKTWAPSNQGLHNENNYLIAVTGNKAFASSYESYAYSGTMQGDTVTLYQTDLATKQWSLANGWPLDRISSMAVNASGNYFITGSKGNNWQNGIFTSHDEGTTWSQTFSGITQNGSYEDAVSSLQTDGDTLYAGTYYSGIYKSWNNGTTWSSITSKSNGFNLASTPNVYDSTAIEEVDFICKLKNHLYASGYYWSNKAVLMHSDDYGKSWAPISFSSLDPIKKIYQISDAPVRVYKNKIFTEVAYYQSPGHYKMGFAYSDDFGKTWLPFGPDFPDSYPFTYEIVGDYFYASGITGLWRLPISFNVGGISLFTQNAQGRKNTEISVPVKANNFKNIISSQFTVSWDTTVAKLAAIENFGLSGITTSSFGTTQSKNGIITFSWSAPSLIGQTLADSSVIFNIRLTLTGKYGAKTKVTVTDLPLSIEVVDDSFQIKDVNMQSGVITIDSLITMTGRILYLNNQPIQNATVTVSGIDNMTTAEGNYTFTKPAGINYTITPSKNNDPNLMNGIDVEDVAIMRRHILSVDPITNPYSLISADVNKSKTISTLDLDYVQSLILGINQHFPGNHLWTFTPTDYVFPDKNNPFQYPDSIILSQIDGEVDQDFIAMKLGDVNSDRDNSQSTRFASTQKMIFDIQQERIIDDLQKLIEIPIAVKNFTSIAAMQFTISWTENLEFQNASAGSTQLNFGNQLTTNGKLSAIWDEPSGKSLTQPDGSTLVLLNFKIKDTGNYHDVTISGDITPVKIYNSNLKPVAYGVTYTDRDKNSNSVNVYPNPFEEKISIDFYSKEDADTDLSLLDIYGRAIKKLKVKTTVGHNHVELNGTDFESGFYILDLRVDAKTYKMKLVKD